MPVIVTISRFRDVFKGLQDSCATHEPFAYKLVVVNGDEHPRTIPYWSVVVEDHPAPFCFARSANLGIQYGKMKLVEEDMSDGILLINDDCKLSGPLLRSLKLFCIEHPDIGLVSPQIIGQVGSRDQMYDPSSNQLYTITQNRLAMVAVYIPMVTLDLVGYLDTDFKGYGGDDVDYSLRVMKVGLKLAVFRGCPPVMHEHASTSFKRVMTPEEYRKSSDEMFKLVMRKHGHTRTTVQDS